MVSRSSDPLAALREWGYQPGPHATDHADLFPDDFEWGLGDDDDAIFDHNWIKVARRGGVVWLRFSNPRSSVPDEVWDDSPCIFKRSRFTGTVALSTSFKAAMSILDRVEEEGLFAFDNDDDWVLFAMTHGAKAVDPFGSSILSAEGLA